MLKYVEAGRGPALIFIPAFPPDHSMWSGQMEFFRSRYRVVPWGAMKFLLEARERPAGKSRLHIDVEKPFWWDVPVWVASGQIDTIGLANNHQHRDGMMDNEAWGRPRPAGSANGTKAVAPPELVQPSMRARTPNSLTKMGSALSRIIL